jgi:hypothetical protein
MSLYTALQHRPSQPELSNLNEYAGERAIRVSNRQVEGQFAVQIVYSGRWRRPPDTHFRLEELMLAAAMGLGVT